MYIFYQFLICKTFTKISRNTLKTHRNFSKIFIKAFLASSGVNNNLQGQNSKKVGKSEIHYREQAQAHMHMDPGSKGSVWNVGLIQRG
jgi:hypothetical protein